MATPDPIVEALREFTTCDVSDALVKLRIPNGGFLTGLTMWSPERQAGETKIIGPAYTVKYVPLSDPAPKMAGHYIDSVPPGAVLFVSSPPGIPNAVYGGLMSARARTLGAAGTVVDGRVRDLQEQRAMGYPVFARDAGTAPPAARLKVVATDVPVRLQQQQQQSEEAQDLLEVRPGDYLVGDLNGVVVLPRELAERALVLMREGVQADEKMMSAIEAGMEFVEASRRFRGR